MHRAMLVRFDSCDFYYSIIHTGYSNNERGKYMIKLLILNIDELDKNLEKEIGYKVIHAYFLCVSPLPLFTVTLSNCVCSLHY
jgi:hypothetical protein